LDRRDLVWINVTRNPTAEWVARQITEAFPWDEAPQYLIRDRDHIYGAIVTRRLRAMGIRDKPAAAASPWQNGFAERLIGSIRRECLDHIVVFGEAHLRRILRSYSRYYNDIRTHRSLDKDAPVSRRCSELEASNRSPSSADSITAMRGYRFSVHTGPPFPCYRRSAPRTGSQAHSLERAVDIRFSPSPVVTRITNSGRTPHEVG
jgi:Integrase core domain